MLEPQLGKATHGCFDVSEYHWSNPGQSFPSFIMTSHRASYIVTRLSTLRFNVLMYIVSFARHCLLPKHAEKNGLQAPVLGKAV